MCPVSWQERREQTIDGDHYSTCGGGAGRPRTGRRPGGSGSVRALPRRLAHEMAHERAVGVNGQGDIQVDGRLAPRPVDSVNPGGRTAVLA